MLHFRQKYTFFVTGGGKMKLKFRFWKYTISLSVEKSRLIIGGNRMGEGLHIEQIANWFLSKESMSHKKLQKMCYYAYCWNWVLNGNQLFPEKFQAWVHGPVCPKLYKKYRGNGWKDLPMFEGDVVIPEDVEGVLDEVMFAYGHLNGNQLETLTHQEQPWLEARDGVGPLDASVAVLNDTTIRDYYTKMYETEMQGD